MMYTYIQRDIAQWIRVYTYSRQSRRFIETVFFCLYPSTLMRACTHTICAQINCNGAAAAADGVCARGMNKILLSDDYMGGCVHRGGGGVCVMIACIFYVRREYGNTCVRACVRDETDLNRAHFALVSRYRK